MSPFTNYVDRLKKQARERKPYFLPLSMLDIMWQAVPDGSRSFRKKLGLDIQPHRQSDEVGWADEATTAYHFRKTLDMGTQIPNAGRAPSDVQLHSRQPGEPCRQRA